MENRIPRLHQDMGPRVLEHLVRMCDEFQPEKMFATVASEEQGEVFVAGQAVASAVSELFGDGSCVVYNDIDAFVMSHRALEAAATRKRLATLQYEVMGLEDDPYNHVTLVSPMSVYMVRSTARRGMVNTVHCHPQVNFRGRPNPCSDAFLRSFDLNCVQVAVRLSDGKLVWTRAFQEFTATKQMLVMNPKTPIHTVIRYLRKKQELAGVFGNDEQTMELLTAAQLRVRERLAGKHGDLGQGLKRECEAQLSIGSAYTGKARALGSELENWFSLNVCREGRTALYTLTPRSVPDSRLMDPNVASLLLPTYARALRGHWKKHVCAAVLGHLEQPYKRYRRMAVEVGQERAVATQQDRMGVTLVDKLLREHPNIGPWLKFVSFEGHAELARAMREAERRHGMWIFGVLETHGPDKETFLRFDNRPQETGATLTQWLESTIERLLAEERDRKQVHQPAVPPLRYAGYDVRELWTLRDLAEEGVRQHHCVAGYVGAVREGALRIISMRRHRSEESLTMELSPRLGGGFAASQVHGLQNRLATVEERQVATSLALLASFSVVARKFGVTLSESQASWLLRNEMVLEAFANIQDASDKGLTWKKRHGFRMRQLPLMTLTALKLLLIRARQPNALRFGQLQFVDKAGKHHLTWVHSAPWALVLKFLLQGDQRLACGGEAGTATLDIDDQISF